MDCRAVARGEDELVRSVERRCDERLRTVCVRGRGGSALLVALTAVLAAGRAEATDLN
jgi:hypothetical protein